MITDLQGEDSNPKLLGQPDQQSWLIKLVTYVVLIYVFVKNMLGLLQEKTDTSLNFHLSKTSGYEFIMVTIVAHRFHV